MHAERRPAVSFSFRGTSSPETPAHAVSRRPLRSPLRSRGSLAALVGAVGMMLLLSVSAAAFAAGPIRGVVVDSSGRPVPRALVRVVTRDGAPAGSLFTEADGS